MTDDEIHKGLQNVFNGVFRRTDILLTPSLTANQVPGWDSFHHVSLIVAIEEFFLIKLSDSDVEQLDNIGDLANAIARKFRK